MAPFNITIFDALAPRPVHCPAEGTDGHSSEIVVAAATLPSLLLLISLSFILYMVKERVLAVLETIQNWLTSALTIIEKVREWVSSIRVGRVDPSPPNPGRVDIPANLCDSERIAMREAQGQQWI